MRIISYQSVALAAFLIFQLGCGHSTTRPASKNKVEQKTFAIEKSQSYFNWPVVEARLSRGFKPKRTGKGRRKRPHFGIDLAAPKNTPILASHSGWVIYTGKQFHGYGKMILIEGDHGWATLYGHLNKINVYEGKKVSAGDVIGLMGRTGRATGVHLHFEIRHEHQPVDPLLYLPAGQKLIHQRAEL